MVHDSVREELITKISPLAKPVKIETKPAPPVTGHSQKLSPPRPPAMPPAIEPPRRNIELKPTRQILSNPTSPTLVEFHNKNAAVPEWRLQLQNVVRQRKEGKQPGERTESAPSVRRVNLPTKGATALKPEVMKEIEPIVAKNPTLANALQRIADSRERYLVEETPRENFQREPLPAQKYPFQIAPKQPGLAGSDERSPRPAVQNPHIRPLEVARETPQGRKFDTNKLPPLPESVAERFNTDTESAVDDNLPEVNDFVTDVPLSDDTPEMELTAEEIEYEEVEDCAPVAMRFTAGVFDLIIGSFASLILLSPFMLFGGEWFSYAGLVAFAATTAFVMFIYLTTAIGLKGRSFGMKFFSLEVIDIEGEDYPSFHQAAVSSSIYLLSLALGGIGFATIPFNEERRAVHDLLSGTIVVKEFDEELS